MLEWLTSPSLLSTQTKCPGARRSCIVLTFCAAALHSRSLSDIEPTYPAMQVPGAGGRRHMDGAVGAAVVCCARHPAQPLHPVQGHHRGPAAELRRNVGAAPRAEPVLAGARIGMARGQLDCKVLCEDAAGHLLLS